MRRSQKRTWTPRRDNRANRRSLPCSQESTMEKIIQKKIIRYIILNFKCWILNFKWKNSLFYRLSLFYNSRYQNYSIIQYFPPSRTRAFIIQHYFCLEAIYANANASAASLNSGNSLRLYIFIIHFWTRFFSALPFPVMNFFNSIGVYSLIWILFLRHRVINIALIP